MTSLRSMYLALGLVLSTAEALSMLPRPAVRSYARRGLSSPRMAAGRGVDGVVGNAVSRRAACGSALVSALGLVSAAGAATAVDANGCGILGCDRSGNTEGVNNGSAPPSSGMVKTKGVAGGKVGVTLKSPTSELVEVGFTSPWNEKKGQVLAFGDSKLSQDAFLALAPLKSKGAAGSLSKDAVLDLVFGSGSKLGGSSPFNIKVVDDTAGTLDGGKLRVLDITCSLQATNIEVAKRVAVGIRTEGSTAVLLIAGTNKAKWAESADEAKAMVSSLTAGPGTAASVPAAE